MKMAFVCSIFGLAGVADAHLHLGVQRDVAPAVSQAAKSAACGSVTMIFNARSPR